MPSEETGMEPLRRLAARLGPVLLNALQDDPALRAELRQCLLDLLEHPLLAPASAPATPASTPAHPSPDPPPSVPTPQPTASPAPGTPPSATPPPPIELDPAEIQSLLHKGQVPATDPVAPQAQRRTYNGPSLKELGRRFRFKARACRQVAEALQAPEPPEGPIELRALTAEAKGVRLWMHGASVHAAPAFGWIETAEAFDLAARTAIQAAEAGNPGDGPQGTAWLQLLASVQCRLRTVLTEVHPGVEDPDQIDLHGYLRAAGARCQVMLKHLKLTDKVSKAAEAKLERTLTELTPAATPRASRQSDPATSQFKRLKYHLRHLHGPGALQLATEPGHDVEVIETILRELESLGVPLHDERLADVEGIDPQALDLPHGPGIRAWIGRRQAAVQALAQAEAAAEAQETDPEEDEAEDAVRTSPEIELVRQRLEGRVLLLVGGDPQPRRIRAYEEAFHLERLEWPETRHHHSNERLIALIERPDVAAVAVAIRWASHSKSELREVVRAAGKPWIVLERGLNPSQFAAAYLAQASGHGETTP